MNRKKNLLKFTVLLLMIVAIALIPLLGVYIYANNLPRSYNESYYAALPVKYDYLKSVEGEKIVVIGGSSVAFGIDSQLVEKELGRPCVNFGLYAAFGMKVMLDLSKPYIHKGDIVVLAPEISSQMYSDYVGYDYILQAIEGRTDMALNLGTSYIPGFLSKLGDYAENTKKLAAGGGAAVSGVYALSSFDNKGNMTFKRDSNIMEELYSPDNLPELTPAIVTDSFAKMINDYVKEIKKKGAKVYFSFCPLNELSVKDCDKEGFVKALREKLDCEIIASLDDHILDYGYFYDSNFHANDAGIVYNTVLLINDLKRVSGTMTMTETRLPSPLFSSAAGEIISSGATDTFTYNVTTTGVTITGLTDEGKKAGELVIPESLENYSVTKIGLRAFEGCLASRITLPAGIKSLSSGIFANAANLTRVELNAASLPEVGNNLLADAADALKIYVPGTLYGSYVTDYFWGAYSEKLEEIK